MLPEAEKNTSKSHGPKDHPGVQQNDPYLVSLVTRKKHAEAEQSENINVVLDEMQGTASRRRAQPLKPDS